MRPSCSVCLLLVGLHCTVGLEEITDLSSGLTPYCRTAERLNGCLAKSSLSAAPLTHLISSY